MCTNLGVSALLRLFNELLEYMRYAKRDVEYQMLSPDAIVGMVSDFVSSVVEWFNAEYDSDRSRFRGRFGSGGPIVYALNLMEIIHDRFPDFNPPDLAEHIRAGSAKTISHAQQLVTEIEDTIRNVTVTVLKAKYGDDESGWWRQGVPQTVRSSAASRSEMSVEGGGPDKYMDMLDYKKIAEQSKVWRDFERYWTINRSLRSKSDRLEWMDRLSTIRNRLSHSGRRHVGDDEVTFLEEIWVHVGDEWNQLRNQSA